MQPVDNGSPTDPLQSPPLAASALSPPKARPSSGRDSPLSQSELTLPIRKPNPSTASLYASTFTPPGSRSMSPVGRPSSRATAGSIFGAHANNARALVDGAGDSPGDPLNLITKAFVPHIAVYTSDDTDALIREKGFDNGLWELLRPFGERVQGKVIVRDSTSASHAYEDYSVRFVRFGENIEHPTPASSGLKSPQQPSEKTGSEKPEVSSRTTTSKGGNLVEIENIVERHLTYAEESFFGSPHIASKDGLNVEVPSTYYSLFIRRLLSGLSLAPHETFAHPVACVIAISSRNTLPIETLRKLYSESTTGDKRLPNWVDPEYLRYYVLVHDEERDDIARSMSLFEQMKRNLGLHCHLLRIRGTQSAPTDDDSIPLPQSEWISASEELAYIEKTENSDEFDELGRYIFESDATAIRTFVREMVTQSIIPTMERHVSVWNDQVAAKKRGIAGRFAGLTKRWGFGGSTKGAGGPSSGSNYDTHGFYRYDSTEAVIRKLADYSFMLRDWKLAWSTYDLIRSDFNNDKAWKYHAAANEMAAISMLISPQNISAKTRIETTDQMIEQALYSYLSRCSSPYGAVRTLALSMELLRLRNGSSIDDGARFGIRLLESKVMGPIGEALIRERIAVCYASKKGIGSQQWSRRKRKSAFWSVLGAEAWLAQAKFVQAQRCINEAGRTYADLPSGNGIAKFEVANAFMCGIERHLNHSIDVGEQYRADVSEGEEEVVDEESEALDHHPRRQSMLGPTGTSLESAPLRSQTSEENQVDNPSNAEFD